jgi:tRNA (cmo5U34)-methyltransferase
MAEEWKSAEFARLWVEENTEQPHSPLREEQLDLLIDIIRAYPHQDIVPQQVLDLGCGAGIVMARVLEALPDVRCVGLDGSPPMLEMARERLAPYDGRYELALGDFETLEPAAIPGGPFGAAFAVQAIHNATDEGKRRAFAAMVRALAPGGVFILQDRVRIEGTATFPAYRAVWGHYNARHADSGWQEGEGRTMAEHERAVRERGDKPGSLEQNLLWMREAGFAQVAVVHLVSMRAVIVGIAPE